MRLRQIKREEPEVNLTALIDVVFLLLIFFMVSTTFKQESEITIDLPKATAEPVEREAVSVEITIDVEGRYYVNQQLVVNKQMPTLMKALQRVIGDAEVRAVVISADANSPHQALITAMDAARQLGIVHVSLATRQSDAP